MNRSISRNSYTSGLYSSRPLCTHQKSSVTRSRRTSLIFASIGQSFASSFCWLPLRAFLMSLPPRTFRPTPDQDKRSCERHKCHLLVFAFWRSAGPLLPAPPAKIDGDFNLSCQQAARLQCFFSPPSTSTSPGSSPPIALPYGTTGAPCSKAPPSS